MPPAVGGRSSGMPPCCGQQRLCAFSVFYAAAKWWSHLRRRSTHRCTFDMGDVALDSADPPTLIQVRLKASQTDPFRQGVSVYLGATGGDICPVAAVLDYMVRRGPGVGPFFTFLDGSFLAQDRFVRAVREALQSAGVDSSSYAGHSFRIGAATTVARQGVPDSTIKMLGRWESSAYILYNRTPREALASVSRVMVEGMSSSTGIRR